MCADSTLLQAISQATAEGADNDLEAEWNEIEAGFSGLGIKQFLFPKGVSGG